MRPEELHHLEPGSTLSFGELELDVRHTPGHTGGSVVFVLAAAGDRPEVLFTGDTLFAGSVGRTDLPGGSADMLAASLGLFRTRPADAVVLPGHGPQSTIGAERPANPFLIPLTEPTSPDGCHPPMPDFYAPKGVPDYYPPTSTPFVAVRETLQSAARRAGYQPIELPVFEDTRLFARGVGRVTDVVSKEMYTFADRATGRSRCAPKAPPG